MIEMNIEFDPKSSQLQTPDNLEAPFSDIKAHRRAEFLSRYIPVDRIEEYLDDLEGRGFGFGAVQALRKFASFRPKELLEFPLDEEDNAVVLDDDKKLRFHPNLLQFASEQPDKIKNLSRDAARGMLGLLADIVGRDKPEDQDVDA